MEDPYFVVRDELSQSLQVVENLYEKWKRMGEKMDAIRQSQNPGALGNLTNDYKWTTNEIKNNIKSMEWDLKDLEDTIKVVESNPAKFQNVTAKEIGVRRTFVKDLRSKITSIKEAVNTERTAEKAGIPKKPFGSGTSSPYPLSASPAPLPPVTEGFAGMQQQMILQQQDVQLDAVLNTITAIKEQSHVIGREIGDQAILLGGLEREVDQTQSKLDTINGRLNKVIKSMSKSPSTVCIFFLIIVLIVLLFYLIIG